jgi:tricarboxylate carrier
MHDLDSYWGRVAHFFDMVDLRNVLVGDAELRAAQAALADVRAGRAPPPAFATDEAKWRAKRIVDSAVHPDTGELIPLVFRMSFFMPSNLPITAGMLLSGTGLRQVFWQWLNQSYNAGFNYANRNASVPISMPQLAASYGVATGVACGMSFALGKVVERLQASAAAPAAPGAPPRPPPGFGLKLLSRGLPWMAVASAGAANALAMRYKEGVEGIDVRDEDGRVAGRSVAAGRAGLLQVALTRAALPVPILLLPPFLLDALAKAPVVGAALARGGGAKLAVELAVFACFLQGALPFAVALFPQTGRIAAADLEPEFRGRVSAVTGRPVEFYTYNKGV